MEHTWVIPITFDVFKGGALVRSEIVAEPFVVLGRDGATHLWIDDDELSAKHVMIETTANEVRLVSLGVATFVNGLPVERCLLCTGDQLRVGQTTIRISLGDPVEFVAKKVASSEPEPEAIVPTHYRETPDSARRSVIGDLDLLEARSAVHSKDLEADASSVIELSIAWNNTLLHVAHVERDESFVLWSKRPKRMISGFVAGPEVLGALSECAVVVRRGKAQYFVVSPGASGSLELDGVERPLEALIAEGLARPSAAVAGAYEVELRSDGRYTMQAGGFTVRAKRVARARRTYVAPTRDYAWNGALLASLVLVFGSLFATRAAMASDEGALARETEEDRLDYLRGLIERQQRWSDERSESQRRADQLDQAIKAHGSARFGPESRFGRRSTQRPLVYRHSGKRAWPRSSWPGAPAGPSEQRTTPFGALVDSSPNFADPSSAFTGTPVGLGATGAGWGGAAISNSGAASYGATAASPRFGFESPPRLGCQYPPRPSGRVRAGAPIVTGLLPPESVRRVAVRNSAQLRFCYEAGLRARPRLAGRVEVRFIIGGNGTVLGSTVLGTNLEDRSVASCMAHAVRTWQFAEPDGRGIVTVNFPFDLEPPE
jgi:hypothetical protein